mmetsp:Transcript_114149/g.261989  ORF Transcript_114149/g.261989 Transcript_114149/m.261989 type:complete len:233 (+) Transcript_114149:969-1667(+)
MPTRSAKPRGPAKMTDVQAHRRRHKGKLLPSGHLLPELHGEGQPLRPMHHRSSMVSIVEGQLLAIPLLHSLYEFSDVHGIAHEGLRRRAQQEIRHSGEWLRHSLGPQHRQHVDVPRDAHNCLEGAAARGDRKLIQANAGSSQGREARRISPGLEAVRRRYTVRIHLFKSLRDLLKIQNMPGVRFVKMVDYPRDLPLRHAQRLLRLRYGLRQPHVLDCGMFEQLVQQRLDPLE